MDLADAITLIRDGFQTQQKEAVWADLGCGTGLFTNALAQLLPPGSVIYAIDKLVVALRVMSNSNNVTIRQLQLDFEKETSYLNSLDGILMANSLHYVRDKNLFIQLWQRRIKPEAPFVIVEYDTEKANPWVPFPVSFYSLKALFETAGYKQITKIGTMRSQYQNGNLYAALVRI